MVYSAMRRISSSSSTMRTVRCSGAEGVDGPDIEGQLAVGELVESLASLVDQLDRSALGDRVAVAGVLESRAGGADELVRDRSRMAGDHRLSSGAAGQKGGECDGFDGP